MHAVIAPPSIDTTIYVDALNGNDGNDGSSEAAAFKTLHGAKGSILGRVDTMFGVVCHLQGHPFGW